LSKRGLRGRTEKKLVWIFYLGGGRPWEPDGGRKPKGQARETHRGKTLSLAPGGDQNQEKKTGGGGENYGRGSQGENLNVTLREGTFVFERWDPGEKAGGGGGEVKEEIGRGGWLKSFLPKAPKTRRIGERVEVTLKSKGEKKKDVQPKTAGVSKKSYAGGMR